MGGESIQIKCRLDFHMVTVQPRLLAENRAKIFTAFESWSAQTRTDSSILNLQRNNGQYGRGRMAYARRRRKIVYKDMES